MTAVFSFLYLKKIKISKINVHFGKFQNYPRSPLHRATGSNCNFFSSNLQRSPWRGKKRGGLSPPQRATGACRPPLGRQGPVARWGGRQAFFLFFFQGPILSYSSVYSSSSSARSRPLTPTARNLSFIKSREKIARTSLISRALWNPQT